MTSITAGRVISPRPPLPCFFSQLLASVAGGDAGPALCGVRRQPLSLRCGKRLSGRNLGAF